MITFVFLLSLFVAIFFETGGLERCSSPEQDILEHVLPPPSPSSDPCTFRLSEFVHLTLLTHLARLTNCRTWVTEKVFWEVCHHRTPPLQILQTVNQKCGKMWGGPTAFVLWRRCSILFLLFRMSRLCVCLLASPSRVDPSNTPALVPCSHLWLLWCRAGCTALCCLEKKEKGNVCVPGHFVWQ